MSSSAISRSSQSVRCMERYCRSIQIYPPAIMECHLCLWALALKGTSKGILCMWASQVFSSVYTSVLKWVSRRRPPLKMANVKTTCPFVLFDLLFCAWQSKETCLSSKLQNTDSVLPGPDKHSRPHSPKTTAIFKAFTATYQKICCCMIFQSTATIKNKKI